MSTKRLSTAAALVAQLPAAPAVEILAPATAAQLAAQAAKTTKTPETFVDQGTVDAFLNAEGAVADCAIALFYACIAHRVSPTQFVNRSDAKVRASEFNCAHTVAGLIGAKGTRGVILKASNAKGDKRGNVLAALRSAKVTASSLKGSAMKVDAIAKEVAKRADAASAEASAKDAPRQATRQATRAPRVPTGPGVPKAGTVGAYIPTLIAALIDAQVQLAKTEFGPRQGGKVKDLSEALESALDAAKALAPGAEA